MLCFLADENFDHRILRGLLDALPLVDLILVQDVGLTSARDPRILEWAAREGRILLTHDVRTVPDHAYRRMTEGQPMPGVVVVPQSMPIRAAIEDLVLIVECSGAGEWEQRVVFLPF